MSNAHRGNMLKFKKYRKAILMFIDTIIAIISYLVPYVVTNLYTINVVFVIEQIIIFIVIYIGTFVAMGVYKNMCRYAGIQDVYQCLKASVIGNLLFFIITFRVEVIMKCYIYILVFLISSFCTIVIRIVYRAIKIIINRKTYVTKNKINVMIIGAGQATALLLNELEFNNPHNYLVKCIIDDDKTKKNRDMHNVSVVGDTNKIIEIASCLNIELIIISMPSVDKENKKRILDICSKTNCKLKILPEICGLISYEDQNIAEKVRDVQVEDLLCRDPITFDCAMTKQYIENKTILVTGGGGSIGSELCRQISSYFPKKLIILDIYENSAYEIQQELIRTYGYSLNLEVEIASVRDKNKLDKIFASKNIDIVFHAAAHKHVPLMEHNPEEAIKNNIIGTYNTVLMADKYKVDKFVLISTDKAVNPTSVMGATKRICEMVLQSFDKSSSTDFVAVRFGNVLGSNGSVIPLFIQQIKEGGPVTVTHEEVTRYFMTIVEAVQLVMRAASIANGGEIFVLDMGEPVKIKDLAYKLIRLSGFTPNKDIKIEFTGLRPGEKLYEELIISEEKTQLKTCVDKIFIEKPTEFNDAQFFEILFEMEKAAQMAETEIILNLLEKIVPSFKKTTND